ncbi:YncE family protein [Novosphingobium album (ex Hu et al. 2023)]|uniref:YncE family protein n=1 Tax=Novosphingobium album (ex Hu et al. 2023) TaxID=2930093 RepID=A0ABT0B4E0_9SPHN|nr:YncE family protein [Novosphingobium album (ex Hu et al. 2023)]MCJ2179684.1 YncE family protein [Novosphingobium album (ex Hu et al. 2023)]
MDKLKLTFLTATAGLAAISAPAFAGSEQVISIPGFADFLAVDGDTVWTTNKGRVEAWSRYGKLAEVPMTRPCGAMTISHGSLWVADCQEGAVVRINIRTAQKIATIPTGIANPKGELNVASGAGSIWVASDDKGVISRIDPETNAVVAKITVDPGTWYLSFGLGSLWAVSANQQSLQRIDPESNSVAGKTPLGKEPGFLVAGEGAVWVQEQGDGTVARVDFETGEVTDRIKVGDNLKWGDIDTGDGKVWLRTTDDQVFAVIDARTNAIKARIGAAAGSGALRYTGAGVWTTAHDEHTLTWWPADVLNDKLAD